MILQTGGLALGDISIKSRSSCLANSIAFFNSNDIFETGADSTLPFHQHRDIFYLSGVDQEESVLVLFPAEIHK